MTLQIEVSEQCQSQLEQAASASGLRLEDFVRLMLEQSASKRAEAPKRSLVDIFEEIWRDTPPEELAKLPEDGATQHDHYIYGLPKREV